jgi:hypothetical protein
MHEDDGGEYFWVFGGGISHHLFLARGLSAAPAADGSPASEASPDTAEVLSSDSPAILSHLDVAADTFMSMFSPCALFLSDDWIAFCRGSHGG